MGRSGFPQFLPLDWRELRGCELLILFLQVSRELAEPWVRPSRKDSYLDPMLQAGELHGASPKCFPLKPSNRGFPTPPSNGPWVCLLEVFVFGQDERRDALSTTTLSIYLSTYLSIYIYMHVYGSPPPAKTRLFQN